MGCGIIISSRHQLKHNSRVSFKNSVRSNEAEDYPWIHDTMLVTPMPNIHMKRPKGARD
jgi:hypothetical protein